MRTRDENRWDVTSEQGCTSNLKKYDFHGDLLDVVEREGQLFVALKPMCRALGIDDRSQRAKLAGKAWAATEVIITPAAEDGKAREMFCLHIDSVPMWLATIEASKVGESVRGKLLRYQLECARVLRDHFMPRPAEVEPPPAFDPSTAPTQARIGDDARASTALRGWCRTAATLTGRTIQSLQGELRKPWGVASIYRVPLVAFDHTIAALQRISVETATRKRLPADRRQVEMWGSN